MRLLRWSVLALALLAVVALLLGRRPGVPRPPIRVGILHSLTGTMAISERAVVDATRLALEQINDQGGLLGRRVEAVVADGRSDPEVFEREALRLITREKVCVVFGCWTSASRRTVRPVFERLGHLLVYPVQYEGLEESPNIVYTGAAPNQQILPAVKYFLDHRGKRFYLVGSDYVYPRMANMIVREQLKYLGGEVVGEDYLPLGSQDAHAIAKRIAAAKPDVILNTVNGDSSLALARAIRAAGLRSSTTPVVCFSLGENELQSFDVSWVVGDYAVWNYFQTIDSPANAEFVEAYQARFGSERPLGDPLEAAWFGVKLWAQAVRQAGTEDVDAVRPAMRGQRMEAPEGLVYVDAENQHTWKHVRIGRIRPDGLFDIVWTSETLIRPSAYPPYKSRAEWDAVLESLYRSWGHRWENPAP